MAWAAPLRRRCGSVPRMFLEGGDGTVTLGCGRTCPDRFDLLAISSGVLPATTRSERAAKRSGRRAGRRGARRSGLRQTTTLSVSRAGRPCIAGRLSALSGSRRCEPRPEQPMVAKKQEYQQPKPRRALGRTVRFIRFAFHDSTIGLREAADARFRSERALRRCPVTQGRVYTTINK
jgi:hypothetical protein